MRDVIFIPRIIMGGVDGEGERVFKKKLEKDPGAILGRHSFPRQEINQAEDKKKDDRRSRSDPDRV
jgi:hypothetical protein